MQSNTVHEADLRNLAEILDDSDEEKTTKCDHLRGGLGL